MNEPQASLTPKTDALAESWTIHSDRERLKQCLVHARRLERQRDLLVMVLEGTISALEQVHDSHKRRGLPLTDGQFARLNAARAALSEVQHGKGDE